MKESYTQQYQSKTTLDRPKYVNWQLRACDTVHLFDQRLDATSESISRLDQHIAECSKASELAYSTLFEAQRQIRDLSHSLEARLDTLETQLDKLLQQQQSSNSSNTNSAAILILLDKWESRIQTLLSTQAQQSDRCITSAETRLEDKIINTHGCIHTTMNTLADRLSNVEKKVQVVMDQGRMNESRCSGVLDHLERLVGRVEGVEQGLVEVGVVQAAGRGAHTGLEESVFRLRSEVLKYMNTSNSYNSRGSDMMSR